MREKSTCQRIIKVGHLIGIENIVTFRSEYYLPSAYTIFKAEGMNTCPRYFIVLIFTQFVTIIILVGISSFIINTGILIPTTKEVAFR